MASPDAVRKKSPRAPSIALDEALERAEKIYEKERLHAAPTDVVAQDMGYKDANNGKALSAIASLRYYGLVERHGNGLLSITKDVEGYKFAPGEEMRKAYLRRFLTAPAIFAELLERYAAGLPSDGNLRYELIQRDFLPATAESLVNILRRSAEFAQFYEPDPVSPAVIVTPNNDVSEPRDGESPVPSPPPSIAVPDAQLRSSPSRPLWANEGGADDDSGHDRIPVRLTGGRKAWLLIPQVFRKADKQRLKAQIDLLLTEDEEADEEA